VYSPISTPYGPTSFLATSWRVSTAELSGYAQQDAHEFFIFALNQIHSTSRGSTNVSCNCIIHSTFAGQLQSDVRCERCGNVTTTVDPMSDVSLELKGKTGEVVSGENTLEGCLRRFVPLSCAHCAMIAHPWSRFTHPEKLGPKEYSCVKCGKASHVRLEVYVRSRGP
jgi:ubiquitin carboxyl-terminal hydrolase 22/27/51